MRNLFDQYDHPENRLSHALAICLHEIEGCSIIFCYGMQPPCKSSELFVVEQSLPGDPPESEEQAERKGLPDIVIHDAAPGASVACPPQGRFLEAFGHRSHALKNPACEHSPRPHGLFTRLAKFRLMNQRYLQVSYRNGRPVAAYLYFPRKLGDRATRSIKCEGGLVLDYAAGGRPIGIEITSPKSTTLENLNRALASAHQESIAAQEIQPLLTAAA